MSRMWVVSIGLVALLAACSSPTPAAPASSAAPTLSGTAWKVTQLGGTATIAGHEPTMEFAADAVAGLASCNRYTGAFSQDGAAVKITPGAMTQMMCAADVMTQEQAFTQALTKVASVRSAGDGIELVDSDARAVLTLAAIADLPLEGTTWTLSGLVANDAVTTPVSGSTVTMTIADGTLSGKACNSFHGTVDAKDGTIKVGPLMSTKMACTSEALTKQETQVLTTLQAATTYTIKGDELTISAPDGTGLVFTGA